MKINIIIPVFNDWDSLNYLLDDISKIKENTNLNFSSIDITIIDDASTINQKVEKTFKDIILSVIIVSLWILMVKIERKL